MKIEIKNFQKGSKRSYFGALMQDDEKKEIYKIIASELPHVSIKQALIDENDSIIIS